MDLRRRRARLEALYRRLNRPELLRTDPLELVVPFEDARDRELAGLLASALAYGRAGQIRKSVGGLLAVMGSPRAFVERSSPSGLRRAFAGFRHRWSTGDEVAALLGAAGALVARHGSLEGCLLAGASRGDGDILPAAAFLARSLVSASDGRCGSLVPLVERGSACKRLHLYLRWMVRRDAVDPGGFDRVPAARLVVPLDTHMHRIGRALGLSHRRAADLRTALELTRGFALLRPEDPVRYDFCLTRLGMGGEEDLREFLRGLD